MIVVADDVEISGFSGNVRFWPDRHGRGTAW
jgi:hypothetical protein